jgi:pyruvate,orthophosphate dikinase
MVKNKPVYAFEEADSKKRMLLGGKGAGLSEMTRLKLPVPPGFTITTEVCNKYYDNNRKLPKDVMPAVMKNIAKMEEFYKESITSFSSFRSCHLNARNDGYNFEFRIK